MRRILTALKHFKDIAFSEKYLLITNVAISLSLSATGDFLEQKYERYSAGSDSNWDVHRTRNMAFSGMSVGVICHYWYRWLDRRLPGRTLNVVMKKVLVDQFICSPLYISIFFLTLGILDRKTPQEVFEEMKHKAWKLYLAEWMIWPPAQFINFYWLPLRYRVFYDNLISLGYDVYTSRIIHLEHAVVDSIKSKV